MSDLEIEPLTTEDFGPCDCCGDRSRTVSGMVAGRDEAAYFVHWTLGKVPEHGAHFDLIMGRWGEGTTSADRFAVSVEYRKTEEGPGFMVMDAGDRPVASNPLAGRILRRDDVIGTDLADRVFKIVDAIWIADPRISEVRGDVA